MSYFYVGLVNHSTVLTDEEVAPVAAALKKQVNEHFAPHYGIQADVRYLSRTTAMPLNFWPLFVFDDSDQAGVLGYHDISVTGFPIGKIFARTDLLYGHKWTVTASHELLEMLADPYINMNAASWITTDAGIRAQRFHAYEVCDPCQADEHGYDIDGVRVSDFVLPRWFQPRVDAHPEETYDYCGRIEKPLEILPGGFLSVYDSWLGQGWKSIGATGAGPSLGQRAPVGSRRERRTLSRDQWMMSTSPGR